MTGWQIVDAVPDLMESDVHVWAVRTDGLDAVALRSCLTDEERAAADRYLDPARGRTSIVSRGALRTLLGGYLRRAPVEIPLAVNAHGKPHLDRPGVDLQFNVAHAGAWLLLAFALDRPVGVDVEDTTRAVDIDVLAPRYLDDAERASLASAADPRAEFFRQWVRKEARMKAQGAGFEGRTRDLHGFAALDLPPLGAQVAALATDGGTASVRLFEARAAVSLTCALRATKLDREP